MVKGTVHVLTGNGKGKTTAAIGLALRAVGCGLRVFFAQFLKKGTYSEINAFGRYADQITVEQFGLGRFTRRPAVAEDVRAARYGLQRVREVMLGGRYDLMVLDEVNVAVHLGLISFQNLEDLIRHKPDGLDLIMTGRGASQRLLKIADIVTEMKARKHYYQKGVAARIGIEK